MSGHYHNADCVASALERIADALEAQAAHHESDTDMERVLSIQERAVAASEEHNRHHREAGLPPAEPGPIQ